MIATGRDEASIESLPSLGADAVISLAQPADKLRARFSVKSGIVALT